LGKYRLKFVFLAKYLLPQRVDTADCDAAAAADALTPKEVIVAAVALVI